MKPTVSEPQLLQALQWRYATKAFDSNRKIPAATWTTLQEALVLSASSFGLQPYQFIVVNDLAGGDWDWSAGEPPADHPDYYLRFCKSFSRMGGELVFARGDNRAFVQNLWHALARPTPHSA